MLQEGSRTRSLPKTVEKQSNGEECAKIKVTDFPLTMACTHLFLSKMKK